MTALDLITALALPPQALVNQRVPKKLLSDNAAATAADKRLIQDSIEDLIWVAALKPDTIGVTAYRDDDRDYLELAVLTLSLRCAATPRLSALVHRAIPYPVLLIITPPGAATVTLSLAHIRWAQREADRTVLDGDSVQVTVPANAIGAAFIQAMALPHQPRANLYALYQGWIDTASALQAAELTGQFSVSATPERAAQRWAALHQCQELKAQITQLRAQAGKEKQLPHQVALNLQIRAAQASLTEQLSLLAGPQP